MGTAMIHLDAINSNLGSVITTIDAFLTADFLILKKFIIIRNKKKILLYI